MPIATVQLRFNGWVTEMNDDKKMMDTSGDQVRNMQEGPSPNPDPNPNPDPKPNPIRSPTNPNPDPKPFPNPHPHQSDGRAAGIDNLLYSADAE